MTIKDCIRSILGMSRTSQQPEVHPMVKVERVEAAEKPFVAPADQVLCVHCQRPGTWRENGLTYRASFKKLADSRYIHIPCFQMLAAK